MRTLAAALLLLAACASAKAQNKPDVAVAAPIKAKDGTTTGEGGSGPKGKFRCHMETPAGSHIPEKVCRYEDDTADSVNARRAATEAMQKPNTVQPIR